MSKVIDTLCRRDGITADEASKLVEETRARMAECSYDPIECEYIMQEVLGLEMDYIFDIL